MFGGVSGTRHGRIPRRASAVESRARPRGPIPLALPVRRTRRPAVGLRSKLTGLSAVLSVVSVLVTVLVLHPDGLPNSVSAVDFLVRFALPVLAGYAVYSNPSNGRWIGFSILLVSTFFFLTLLVLLYGEGAA